MRRAEKVQRFLDEVANHLTDAENAVAVCDPEDEGSIEECLGDLRLANAAVGWQLRKMEKRRGED